LKWQVILQKIEIRDFNPLTAGKNKIDRKKKLRRKLKSEIGKSNLNKIQKRANNNPLFIDVCFYLQESDKLGKSKKDLDNLLKILFDVLSKNMVNGQKPIRGLGIMRDDSYIHKIKCEKKVNVENKTGFDLMISAG